MKWYLLLLYGLLSSAVAAPRIASLNPCYDDWLPQLVPNDWLVVPTTEHGNRLEQLIMLQPDYIVAGSFTNARLLQQLAQRSPLHVIQQPNNLRQWQVEVRALGAFLGQSDRAEQWLLQQQVELQQLSAGLSEVLIVMPNYYTWAQDSWVAQLLNSFSVNLVSPFDQGYIGQLRLEQLMTLSTQRVVFEGFSQHYSRGQDWLYHPAVQTWLEGRTLGSITAATASCPAVNAVAYLQQLVGQHEIADDAQ